MRKRNTNKLVFFKYTLRSGEYMWRIALAVHRTRDVISSEIWWESADWRRHWNNWARHLSWTWGRWHKCDRMRAVAIQWGTTARIRWDWRICRTGLEKPCVLWLICVGSSPGVCFSSPAFSPGMLPPRPGDKYQCRYCLLSSCLYCCCSCC